MHDLGRGKGFWTLHSESLLHYIRWLQTDYVLSKLAVGKENKNNSSVESLKESKRVDTMDDWTDFSEEVKSRLRIGSMMACSPGMHKLSHGGQEVLEINYRKDIPRWHGHSKTEKRISTSPRKKDDLRTGGMTLQVRELLLTQEDHSSTSAPQAVHVCDPELWSKDRKSPELAGFPAEPRQWVPASMRGSVSDKGSLARNTEEITTSHFSYQNTSLSH